MSDQIDIRRATRDDLAACVAIVADWSAQTDWAEKFEAQDDALTGFQSAFDQRVVWIKGEPIDAFISLNPELGHISSLYSSTPGKGVGKALLDTAKQGRDFLSLNTNECNTGAIRFYQREGFSEVSRHAPEPPYTLPEIRMEWVS